MTIRLYLIKQRKDGRKSIGIKVHPENGQKWFWVKTRHYIDPTKWRQRTQSSLDPLTNATIENIQLIFAEIIREAIVNKIPVTKEYVRESYRNFLGYKYHAKSDVEIKRSSFFDYFDKYKKKWENQRSYNHIRKFDSVKDSLMRFNPNLNFSDINGEFLEDYIDWCVSRCYNKTTKDVGLSDNTIEKYVTCIRQVCALAYRHDEEIGRDYEDFRYKGYSAKPIWLTKQEAYQLFNVYVNSDLEQLVLDEAAFRYYTGLRSSDVDQIRSHHIINISGQKYLDLTMIKTRTSLLLPLHKKAEEILNEHNNRFRRVAMQHKNSVIKDLAKRAGIGSLVEVVTFSGSKRLSAVLPKYKKISTHTMRRSFGRRFMESIGDINQLCTIYGHSEPKQSIKYIGWQPQELAESINQIEF